MSDEPRPVVARKPGDNELIAATATIAQVREATEPGTFVRSASCAGGSHRRCLVPELCCCDCHEAA